MIPLWTVRQRRAAPGPTLSRTETTKRSATPTVTFANPQAPEGRQQVQPKGLVVGGQRGGCAPLTFEVGEPEARDVLDLALGGDLTPPSRVGTLREVLDQAAFSLGAGAPVALH